MSGTDNSVPTQTTVHTLIQQVLEHYSIRDRQVIDILSRLADRTVVQQLSVVPDLKGVIRVFDGESDDCGVALEWLTALETFGSLSQWPDDFILESARTGLAGAARNWYLARQTEIKSWAEFKKEFGEMFMTTTGVAEQWKRLQNRIQQRIETV